MNWVHLHLALNHVPVLGTPFVGLLLATALWKQSDDWVRLSLMWLVGLALVSIPIKFTGDFAAETLAAETLAAENSAAGNSDSENSNPASWLPPGGTADHEQAADQATTGMFLLGVAAALSLFLGRGERKLPRWGIGLTAAMVLVTFGLMARTAYLGGHLRHAEIRPIPHQNQRSR